MAKAWAQPGVGTALPSHRQKQQCALCVMEKTANTLIWTKFTKTTYGTLHLLEYARHTLICSTSPNHQCSIFLQDFFHISARNISLYNCKEQNTTEKMALSPAAKRQQVFDELYEAASIVPPRPLAELQALFENNTLLYIGQMFGSIQQAETTVAEYCEVQSRAVVYNGQDGAYKNRTALSARCPQLVQGGGTCSFRCGIRGNMRTRRFMCEELDPHNCTVLSTDKVFTGSKRCNYSRHMFAAIAALAGITQDNGAALLEQCYSIPTRRQAI